MLEGRETWSPVALSNMVEAGSSTGVVVDGVELVVWRDSSGRAHVWEDRCPHRGMRMSFGFVRGDHLACLYHGWQYDTAGQCRHIPAHPDLEVPQTIRMRTFATVERNGIIWAGSSADTEPVLLPDEVANITPVRSLYVDATLSAAVARLSAMMLPDEVDLPAVTYLTDCYLSVEGSNTRLLIGVQTLSAGRLALHITSQGKTGAAAIARYAQALRLAMESQVSEAA